MKIKITLITIALFLVTDFTISNIWGEAILNPIEAIRKKYYIDHPSYHHTLKSNYDGEALSWPPPKMHHLCTDLYGFKSPCGSPAQKEYDIAFIGDSFTEGVGVNYEQTFVGLFANANKELKVANWGVATYSPSIYRRKVEDLLSQGFKIKRLFIFVDKSDVFDEAVRYRKNNNGAVISNPEYKRISDIRGFIKYNFLMTYHAYVTPGRLFKQYKNRGKENKENQDKVERMHNLPHGEWTYKPASDFYGPLGIEGGINNSLEEMEKLHLLLSEKGIKMSIGVFPWPGDISRNDLINNRHIQIWRKFCEDRCEYFFDVFAAYHDITKKMSSRDIYLKYFLYKDAHYNEKGNRVVFDVLQNTYTHRQSK